MFAGVEKLSAHRRSSRHRGMPRTLPATPAAILAAFIRGAALLGETPNKEVVSNKLAAIAAANPRKQVGYAFMTGRHWALDQKSKRLAVTKRAIRHAEAADKAAQAAAHEAAMRAELADVIDLIEYSAKVDGRHGLYRYANGLRLAYLYGLPARVWGAYYPHLSISGLYQVKCRSVKAAIEHAASPALVTWLKRQVR